MAPAADAVVAGLGADGYGHVIGLLTDLQKHYMQKNNPSICSEKLSRIRK